MIYKAVVLREKFFRILLSVWDSTRFIKLILLHHVRHRVVSTNGRKPRFSKAGDLSDIAVSAKAGISRETHTRSLGMHTDATR